MIVWPASDPGLDVADAPAVLDEPDEEPQPLTQEIKRGALPLEASASGRSREEFTISLSGLIASGGNDEAFAHAAIDDGADLVIASGPHVLRGLQEWEGHLIDYSLGDFAGYQNFATSGDLGLSGILTVAAPFLVGLGAGWVIVARMERPTGIRAGADFIMPTLG